MCQVCGEWAVAYNPFNVDVSCHNCGVSEQNIDTRQQIQEAFFHDVNTGEKELPLIRRDVEGERKTRQMLLMIVAWTIGVLCGLPIGVAAGLDLARVIGG